MKSEVLNQLPTKRRQMVSYINIRFDNSARFNLPCGPTPLPCLQVLLDLTTASRKGKEWKDMKASLDRAGTLKVRLCGYD